MSRWQSGPMHRSAKPKEGFEVTDAEKEFVKEKIIKPISILTVTPEIVAICVSLYLGPA